MPNEEMNLPVEGGMPAENPQATPGNAGPLTPGGDNTPTKPKQEPKDEEEANKVLEEMMYSPSSSEADPTLEIKNTTDEEKEKIKPDAEELLEILEKGEGEISDKYKRELLAKAMKDPTSIEVETPRGWMTVKDAIGEGFDLSTGDFTNEPIPKVDWEGEISKLDPREQETIRKLTQPGTRQAGPAPAQPVEGAMPPEGGEAMPPEGGLEGAPAEGLPLGGV